MRPRRGVTARPPARSLLFLVFVLIGLPVSVLTVLYPLVFYVVAATGLQLY
ncbi:MULTISPECIES: hypothetical protein [unclassified Streptomyces]|uniref:hypothetical protein n=1 Tax=unclassified Streptomyces TaxID=2593676 RepID=UPI00278C2E3D|nr:MULTISPECIES: hypothetical protein [unclassified Streptomyces]